VAHTCLLAMRSALSAGLAFDTGGESGPRPSDVWVAPAPPGEAGRISEPRVWLTGVDGLREAPAGISAAAFTAKPLVHSALGNYIRRWWVATAPKLGIQNGQADDPQYAAVLSKYGTLNWLLFSWEDKALGGDAILALLTGGGITAERSPEEMEVARRRWDAFCQEAFVRLGPRRFDEMKAQVKQERTTSLLASPPNPPLTRLSHPSPHPHTPVTLLETPALPERSPPFH
jgi:hypothetical protein